MKILTLGNGFIANELPYAKILNRIDYSSKHIAAILDLHKPDILINCIGKAGKNTVDDCEYNKAETALTNTALPILLATECEKKSIHMIHIGSGCIYYGQSPNSGRFALNSSYPDEYNFNYTLDTIDFGWKETDFANPKGYYTKTKYAADLALQDFNNVSILRIRMPLSNKVNSRNLITKLIKYNKIIDIPNSVTFTDDLAKVVKFIIDKSLLGVYHVTNPDTLTAKDIMEEYQKYNKEHKFEIISEKQLDNLVIAKRSNCILSNEKLKVAGLELISAKEKLIHCMKEYCNN